jgi:hypothetical protein
MLSITYDLIEKRPDGTTVVYISFWRYLIFGLLFVFAFYILLSATLKLYHELPSNFWNKWSKDATLTLSVFAGALATPLFAFWFLKDYYKKVQLEIGRSSLGYLKGGVRGGILLSDSYGSINYNDITSLNIKKLLIVNSVLEIQTSSVTHKVIILLSSSEQKIFLECLQEAIHSVRTRK